MDDEDAERKIKRMGAKVAALERRADYLEVQIAERNGSEASLRFDRAELAAIESAILALRWHQSEADQIPDVVVALSDLIDAVEAEHLPTLGGRIECAMLNAREALACWRRRRIAA